MTLGLGRAGAGQGPGQRAVRAGGRRARRGDRRGPGGRPPDRSRSSPPSGRRRRPPSTPWPRSRTSPSARACGSTSTARMRGWSRCCLIVGRRSPAGSAPTRSSSTRTSGCSRRSTPRCCCRAGWTSLHAAFSLRPEYLRTLDRTAPVLRLHRVPAAARAADAGAQAVDAAALVRARGPAAADRAPPRRGAAVRGGSTPTRTGSAWRPVPFSTVCFRYRPRRLAGREDEPETHAWLDDTNTRADGRGQPLRARSSCRTRGSATGSRSGSPIGNLRTEPRHVDLAWDAAPRRGRQPGSRGGTPDDRRRSRSCTSIGRAGAPTTSSWRCSARTTGRSCASSSRRAGSRDVQLWTPRFHGDGRADWDVLVSITYRDWAAMQEHTDAEIAARLYPDQAAFKARGAAPVRAARRALGRRAGAASARRRAIMTADPPPPRDWRPSPPCRRSPS